MKLVDYNSEYKNTSQKDYYLTHSKFGEEFHKTLIEIKTFISNNPYVQTNFLTTGPNEYCGLPQINKISNDKEEKNEWKIRDMEYSFDSDQVYIPHVSTSLNPFPSDCSVILEYNWRDITDPYRSNEIDGLFVARQNGYHEEYYGEENQTPLDILRAYMSGNPLVFMSKIDSNLELFGDCEGGNDRLTFMQYPKLHPRVVSFLSNLKKYIGLVLKIEEIKYDSIDLIPISDQEISIFVSCKKADEITTNYRMKQQSLIAKDKKNPRKFELNNTSDFFSRIANALSFIIENNSSESKKNHFYFTFYKRDRSLRFKALMASRIEKISDDINSLKKLHNPTNYKFDEIDFHNAYKLIEESLKDFKVSYQEYFLSKNETNIKDLKIKKLQEEIEKLKKGVNN